MGESMPATQEFQERIGRIEGLVQKLESVADPDLKRTAKELMESLMELHGAGLERILEIVSGANLVHLLAGDALVGSLLVLYGLHPDDFETRVRRGLDKVRPLLRSHGARIEVIAISETLVHVKIIGAGSSDLDTAVREAVIETAPDAAGVVIEGKPAGQPPGFVPLSSLRAVNGSPAAMATLVQPLTQL